MGVELVDNLHRGRRDTSDINSDIMMMMMMMMMMILLPTLNSKIYIQTLKVMKLMKQNPQMNSGLMSICILMLNGTMNWWKRKP